jgi:hypothetical protein
MNNSTRKILAIAAACAASALLVASLSLPVWKMRMDAPQYQGNEALKVTVYPGKMTGDLDEIVHIQQYVGITIPTTLPQLQWLPRILFGGAIVGFVAAFLPLAARRRTLFSIAAALCVALAASAALAQYQMYKIGHERTHSPLARVQSFTTPLLGDLKFANFHIKSRLGWGSLLIGSALLLQLTSARLSRAQRKSDQPARPVVINPHPAFSRTFRPTAGDCCKNGDKVSGRSLTAHEI